METLTQQAARRPICALMTCYAIAFLLPWTVWGTLIAQQRGLLSWHIPQALAFWVGLPVAYIVAAATSGGPDALLAQARSMLRWRIDWRLYVVAILIAVTLPLTGLIMHFPRGATDITDPPPLAQLPQLALLALTEIALFWLTEEATWRGFAQPRFETFLSPRTAALAVGAAWALWHLPLFAISGSFQANLPVTGFFALTVATAIILAWLFKLSGGSVLLCALYHGAADVTFAATGVLSASPASFWTVVAAHLAVAGVIWRRGFQRPPLTPARSAS